MGFGISAAKYINAAITARTDTLSYVLNNWHHHGERRDALRRPWKIDPYSSALVFDGWKERADKGPLFRTPQFNGPIVWLPKTWLLRVGWRRYGLISVDEVPGGGPE